MRSIIKVYLEPKRLCRKNASLKQEKNNNNTLNQISISYNHKITEKTTQTEKLTTRLSTFDLNYNNKFNNCTDVCDDETFNLTTIKIYWKKFTIECDSSLNGQECIETIVNKKVLNCSCDKNIIN